MFDILGEPLFMLASSVVERRPDPRTTSAPGRLDALGIALLASVLLAFSFIQSHERIFWGDEIMGNLVLNAGSWAAFLARWRAGIDSSGFWFYVFAKPWEWIFGPSELSLRLFSATGIATAAGLIWITARRFYTLPVVAASVGLIFLEINTLRWQLSNGRCYGVFMAAFALVLFLIFHGEAERYRRPSLPFLLVSAVAYDILAGSHILGMLYAGALLAMQISLDLRARRPRIPLYVAAVVGIVAIVLFSIPNIQSTTALGKPVFWTAFPRYLDLLCITDLTDNPVRRLALALVVMTFIFWRLHRARATVYWVLLGFLVLDLLLFVLSRFTTSIYVDRYLLPFCFALVLLFAELLTQLAEAAVPHARLRRLAPWCLLLICAATMSYAHPFPLPVLDYTQSLLNAMPPGLPVVDTDVANFVEMEHYHHGRFNRPFLFPIDPGITADPGNLGGVSGFHEMDNFRKLGLDTPDLQPTDAILSRYPHLLVVTAAVPTTWLAKRILDTHQYAVQDLGPAPGLQPMHLWEAERRSASPISPAPLR
ncbi:MAG: hypothetical protein ACRYFU_25595 [Janthinobacterium lividum]